MKRMIKAMAELPENYKLESLELVEEVFTEHENAAEGRMVRHLVEEIRGMDTYLPELELLMLDETEKVIGYVMFSRFHLEGKYWNDLLILTPAAVKTKLQRQHISKELIEYGFAKARERRFGAVIVEGNPANYRARGFVTAAEHGILPGKSVQLPAIECLMVKELYEGALKQIHGVVEYTDYKTLT